MTTNASLPLAKIIPTWIVFTQSVWLVIPALKHIPGEIGEEKDFSEIIEHAKLSQSD